MMGPGPSEPEPCIGSRSPLPILLDEAAFACRRARFEMIRARSRKLAKDADRPAPPKAVKRQRPTKEDPDAIERIRAARRRIRD